MKLVIVESPTKAKTISKFLGDGYQIRASMGHVLDLPKSKLGIDVENDFRPLYETVLDRKDTLSELKKIAKTADGIILATDPDREGEAIAAHVATVLTSKKLDEKRFARIVFHEITEDAITEALAHPRAINEYLVNAQTARRVLDRLVGYKLSPILWQKVRRGLSAGRVQSVALRLIVEREKEIQKFAKEQFYTVSVVLRKHTDTGKSAESEFELIEINGDKIEVTEKFTLYNGDYTTTKTTIVTQERADEITADLKQKRFSVADVIKKQTKRSPQPPFTTSTLQQEGARRFGFSGKRTMSLAQKLYEEGYITYHRTDSVHLASSAIGRIRNFVKKEYGEKYLPEKPRFFSTKQKLAQEAHEAIRPTDSARSVRVVTEKLGSAFGKLYELIWRRALASQMSDALIESTTVYVDALDGHSETKYRLKTNGSILIFDGFLAANPFGLQDKKLPEFIVQEILKVKEVSPISHETPPPPRYNDASLISSLEDAGIGRPSTYATIISTIESRQYIERQQGRFIPTPIGTAVNEFLVQYFSSIDDIPFTAQIEDDLDRVAKGEKQWVPMIKEFYNPFEKKLEVVKQEAARVKIEAEETNEICPKDGAPLVIRVGRFGKFISCKNFPTCDFKKAYVQEVNIMCPKDGNNPEKPGKIIVRRTRKGRTFYGCSNYPQCDFAVWKLQDLHHPGQKKRNYTKKTAKKEGKN